MSNKTSLFNLISTEFTGLLSVNTVDVMNIISHQIEDTVINHKLPVDFFAGFQRYSFLNRQRARYERLARIARRVFVFGIPDDKTPDIPGIEYIPLDASDSLAQEWFLVINTPNFYTALMTREVEGRDVITGGRRFEGFGHMMNASLAKHTLYYRNI
ncbi:MAG: DICT sensory domain-containing protein [Chloroflexota bacterium]